MSLRDLSHICRHPAVLLVDGAPVRVAEGEVRGAAALGLVRLICQLRALRLCLHSLHLGGTADRRTPRQERA